MKINKNSWHYRVHRFWMDLRWRENVTLCYYFWTVVLGLLKGLVFASIASFLVYGVLTLLYLLGKLVWLFPVHAGCPLALIVPLFLLIRYIRRRRHLRSFTLREPKPDSLVVAYLKARKQRFCPLIEFVPGDDEA